jgi:hypothetical protein
MRYETALVAFSLVPVMTLYGPQAALIAESFAPRLRYSGALGYQLASIVAGGPAPFVATALLATTCQVVQNGRASRFSFGPCPGGMRPITIYEGGTLFSLRQTTSRCSLGRFLLVLRLGSCWPARRELANFADVVRPAGINGEPSQPQKDPQYQTLDNARLRRNLVAPVGPAEVGIHPVRSLLDANLDGTVVDAAAISRDHSPVGSFGGVATTLSVGPAFTWLTCQISDRLPSRPEARFQAGPRKCCIRS